jgi:predicted secreted protein
MAGIKAFGTTLAKGATVIAEITNISGPDMSAEDIDVSSHDSPDGYKEYVQGMKDGGEVSVEGRFLNNASQSGLKTDFDSGAAAAYVITMPLTPAATFTFTAYVKSLSFTAPYEGELGFSATFKVSGKPVLATSGS